MLKRFGFLILSCFSLTLSAQYTDQINSNRPGASIGAFSVGTRVIQFEAGTEFRSYKHKAYNNSKVDGKIGFFSLRYGFLKEQLELTYEGVYQLDQITNRLALPQTSLEREGFLQNFLGIKYLIFDPFKKEQDIDVYSWKANNGFKLRDLIPAVSLTLGANAILKQDNPYPYGDVFGNLSNPIFYGNLGRGPEEEPFISGRATLATQSHFLGTWVFVTNFTYNRILTEVPEMNYILTLTHTINPLWSVYLETQGFSSERYKDQVFRTGAAYLLTDDIQLEATIGANTKDTPSLFFINAGVSYRLDFHRDINPEVKAEEKALRKEEKALKKGAKKAEKANRKRDRKAKKN
ncbi:MAG: transporter [Flavobacteriaceae bacterium]